MIDLKFWIVIVYVKYEIIRVNIRFLFIWIGGKDINFRFC